ncbi:YraN family protein [Aquisalimonas lutea]|uniref:YraN family protein n=1 Tax=Aquisalimonas lutea TaxID=1327750 RepID=UPI0025B57096|nr:YraN family protein [Aquisalimonas lutea]MDN3518074.1 YraN family protein [Aquisalimonas lutea]
MDFQTSKETGQQGEQLIISWLTHRGWTIIDTSDHEFFQENDIDIVARKREDVFTIDVKTDTHPANNLFIEIISNDEKATPGCIYTSRADYWFYYYLDSDVTYVFRPRDIKTQLEVRDYPAIPTKTTGYSGTLYHSVGALVPIDEAPIIQVIPNVSEIITELQG